MAIAARPTTPSLAPSQRDRVTLCVHARRNVPASISRATSGAPQKIPMRPGTTMTRIPSQILSAESVSRNDGITLRQSPLVPQVATVDS